MRTAFDVVKLPLALAALLLTANACTQDADDGFAADDELGADAPDVAETDQDPGIGQDDQAFGQNDPALGQEDQAETADDAQELVDEAVMVVNQMQSDPEVAELLGQARGVFIIPDYAQAGLVVGGEGGEGIALLKTMGAAGGEAAADDPAAADDAAGADDAGGAVAAAGSQWSAPAFYNFGGITAGAEAGVEVGSIAMLLMSEEAAEMFRSEQNNFSVDASAGLTIVDFSARAEAAAGTGDIIVWSDTEGAFAGLTVGINDVNRDDEEIEAFYGPDVDTSAILTGELMSDRAQQLRDALAAG